MLKHLLSEGLLHLDIFVRTHGKIALFQFLLLHSRLLLLHNRHLLLWLHTDELLLLGLHPDRLLLLPLRLVDISTQILVVNLLIGGVVAD